ncbi:hypothetical protein [Sulfitobacter guttiformis]|nr:hypothetical protein [Sulfitobacter guttiformis]KIN72300.1 hypothetical protein Z949_1473 [Sulfitobacter guttiformis KCTC 32187]
MTDIYVTIATLMLFGLSAVIGLIPVHRMIQRREARHEPRRGSAS